MDTKEMQIIGLTQLEAEGKIDQETYRAILNSPRCYDHKLIVTSMNIKTKQPDSYGCLNCGERNDTKPEVQKPTCNYHKIILESRNLSTGELKFGCLNCGEVAKGKVRWI